MTKKIIALILFVFLIPVSQASQSGIQGIVLTDQTGKEIGIYKESHALVIGISDYHAGWSDLPGVKDDLKAVKSLLEKHKFNVIVMKDPTRKEIREAFDQFVSQHGHEYDNRLLVYYSGHCYTLKQKWGGEIFLR
jgi:hypothetical protein